MNGRDVEEILQQVAPYEFAYEGEELGFIYGDPDKTITSIGVTWRPTVKVLKECNDKKIDLLINHEPLFQSKKSTVIQPSRLTYPPNDTRERLLNEGSLTVLRAHSNWDDAPGGNNDTLAKILEIDVETRIPYGRVGRVKKSSLQDYVLHLKTKLRCQQVLIVGDPNKSIQRVAVVSGSGNALTEMIEVAKQEGADVLVSGDIQDSRARFAAELDIALIDAGSYYTETPGMQNLVKLLAKYLDKVALTYLDPGPPWWHG